MHAHLLVHRHRLDNMTRATSARDNRPIAAGNGPAAEPAVDPARPRELERPGDGGGAEDLGRALEGRGRPDVDEGDLAADEDAGGEAVPRQREAQAVTGRDELPAVEPAQARGKLE